VRGKKNNKDIAKNSKGEVLAKKGKKKSLTECERK